MRRHDSLTDAPLVLIVEDYAESREMYAEYLTFSGFRVAEAANGIEALEKCKESPPAVVIMDMSLPGEDGWEVTRRIKADPTTAGIPVIALTGYILAETQDRAFQIGCAAFLRKPCLPDDLLGEIRRVLKA